MKWSVHEQRRTCIDLDIDPGGSPPCWPSRALSPRRAAAPGATTAPSAHRRHRRLPRRPRHRRPPAPARAAALSVTFIPKQINNPYFDAAKEGADKAATELGGTVTQVGPSAATEAQASFIQDATTKGVSAIAISANDPNAVVPALQAAKAAGIKVVGYDSSPAVGAYDVFVNQTDFSLIGQADGRLGVRPRAELHGRDRRPVRRGHGANQNAWIENMKGVLAGDKYKGLKLVDTVYGDDDPQKSTTQAQALLQIAPGPQGHRRPDHGRHPGGGAGRQPGRQVGRYQGHRPRASRSRWRRSSRTSTAPEFGLWSVPDLGYLTYYVADALVKGTITGKEGDSLTVPNLNGGQPYTIGKDSTIILGPPLTFNKDNIDSQDWGPS